LEIPPECTFFIQWSRARTMETAVDPALGGFLPAGTSPTSMAVSLTPERIPEPIDDSPAVVAHQEDTIVGENLVSDPSSNPCEVTVVTDASAYDAGTVVTGTIPLLLHSYLVRSNARAVPASAALHERPQILHRYDGFW
ncbi:hypothetical protein N8152_03170, partial [bacterium]|nr:hypothetical protein [bacterium]